jgi:1,4-dihydroxy-2-naphthoate octaprenyltransferase
MQVCAVIGMAAVVAISFQVPVVGIVGSVSFLGSWFYSAPPLALMGSGWGELSTSLIVALLVPLTGFALQTTQVVSIVLAVSAPLVLIHLAMLLVIEFPDWEADTAAGKKTLTVRLGRSRAAHLHAALIVCAFALIVISAVLKWPAARFAWLATLLAVWQIANMLWHIRHPKANLQVLTSGAVGLFALTSALWLVGFVMV